MNYEEILEKLVKNNERIMVMTAENRAAIRNLPGKIGGRFIDTGITEMTLIGMASGLALRGRIPVAHALASFLTMRAFEFARTDVGIANLPVKLVGGFSGILSDGNGPTHQAIEDVSIMRGIPNMKVFCPADEDDMLICLEKVLLSESPYYIRYNNRKPEYKHNENFEEGKAEIIEVGKDINILTYGALFNEAYNAYKRLKDSGYNAGLINMRTLKPADENIIIDSLTNCSLTVSIEDHFLKGGLYSIIAETALKHNVMGKVIPFAFDEKWFKPALLNDVLEHEKLTPEAISERIINEYLKIKKNNGK